MNGSCPVQYSGPSTPGFATRACPSAPPRAHWQFKLHRRSRTMSDRLVGGRRMGKRRRHLERAIISSPLNSSRPREVRSKEMGHNPDSREGAWWQDASDARGRHRKATVCGSRLAQQRVRRSSTRGTASSVDVLRAAASASGRQRRLGYVPRRAVRPPRCDDKRRTSVDDQARGVPAGEASPGSCGPRNRARM